eukprot:gene20221-biopygen1029
MSLGVGAQLPMMPRDVAAVLAPVIRDGEAVRRVAARVAALEPQRVRLRPAGVHRREPWGERRGGGGGAPPPPPPGRGRLRAPDGGGLGVVPAFADAG